MAAAAGAGVPSSAQVAGQDTCEDLLPFCRNNDALGLQSCLLHLESSGIEHWRGRTAVQACARSKSLQALAALLRFSGTGLVNQETIKSLGLCTGPTLCILLAFRDLSVIPFSRQLGIAVSTQGRPHLQGSEQLHVVKSIASSTSFSKELNPRSFASLVSADGNHILGVLMHMARTATEVEAPLEPLACRAHAACIIAFIDTIAQQTQESPFQVLQQFPSAVRHVHSAATGRLMRYGALLSRESRRRAA